MAYVEVLTTTIAERVNPIMLMNYHNFSGYAVVSTYHGEIENAQISTIPVGR